MKDYTPKFVTMSVMDMTIFKITKNNLDKLHKPNFSIFLDGHGRPLHILKRACDRSYG